MNFINVLILYTAVENECSKSLEKWKYVWDHLPTKSEPMSLLWKWPVLMKCGQMGGCRQQNSVNMWLLNQGDNIPQHNETWFLLMEKHLHCVRNVQFL